eukprot:gnl/MRDRNA2_/MRDRNA2_208375_c0_seq1.p1 gnl/MRDRNA2_/MRDRNA2_208375_c0~~gnl/MRDRNA2_/MRDRNA2_208375_c0_seq1.p1  ORF type:complete len:460 (+),score=59.09 gnl/MRDRNA2_/MRDRNA2_208375_c0_seq1:59-1381(+)
MVTVNDLSQAAIDSKNAVSETWIQSTWFNIIIGCVVSLNAVCLGCEADHYEKAPTFFIVAEHVFTAIFVVEVVLHFMLEGGKQYLSKAWNWLDFILVLMAVVENWIITPLGMKANLGIMTVLRMLRLLKLMRVLKVFRAFKELNMLVNGLVSCIRTLFWSLVFLAAIVYSFALFAHSTIGRAQKCYSPEAPGEPEQCEDAYHFKGVTQGQLFGSVANTMVTLFICSSEGCGESIVQTLLLQEPVYILFWLPFIFITMLGMFNLIIGLICESAMEHSTEAEREFTRLLHKKQSKLMYRLRQIFDAIDEDGSNDITQEEFMCALHTSEEVRQILTDLGLGDETDLFERMDVDRSGSLTFDELFMGVTFLAQGGEPTVRRDLMAMEFWTRAMQRKLNCMEKVLQEQMVTKEDILRIEANQEKIMQYLLADIGSKQTEHTIVEM